MTNLIEDLPKKETFFKQLSELDDEDEGPEDTSGAVQFLANSKKEPQTTERNVRSILRRTSVLNRTFSFPLPKTDSSWSEDVSIVKETPYVTHQFRNIGGHHSKLQKNVLTATNHKKPRVSATISNANKKRKRSRSLDLVPDSQQVFRGLFFFYIPDNDIDPLRKRRIRMAKEHGAIWVQQWRTGVTHIIADRTVSYKKLLVYMKFSELPTGVILVNENYPLDCISDKILFNPIQRQYRIDGQPYHAVPKASSPLLSSSMVSPPLKGSQARPRQSPSCTGDGDEEAAKIIIDRNFNESTANERMTDTSVKGDGTTILDALDAAISEARGLEHLPLDSESDVVEETFDDNSDNDAERRPKALRKGKGSFDASWQNNFSCMQKNDGVNKDENPNARTIEMLQQMAEYYDRTRDHWRTLGYRKAIGQLRKQSTKITTKAEALALPFIGERLADKIEEVVWTNRLRRLESTTMEPNDKSLHTFLKIYGVGFSQAMLWVNQGLRTLDDLRSKAPLTKNQQIGVDHYEDFLDRIPRSEVESHVAFVKAIIATVDSHLQVTVGGSYRRGSSDSGDVDFIVSHPSASIDTLRTHLVQSIIPRLFSVGYLKCTLASTSPTTGTKWHGAAALPGPSVDAIWRRIDFLIVPAEEFGAALLYFTGNDIFSRSIRLLASKKGMRLNQRGLWKDVGRGPRREKTGEGTLVEGRSEEKIFEILRVPWRPPEHRIC